MPCPLTPDIDLDPDPYSVDEVEDSSADGVEFPTKAFRPLLLFFFHSYPIYKG